MKIFTDYEPNGKTIPKKTIKKNNNNNNNKMNNNKNNNENTSSTIRNKISKSTSSDTNKDNNKFNSNSLGASTFDLNENTLKNKKSNSNRINTINNTNFNINNNNNNNNNISKYSSLINTNSNSIDFYTQQQQQQQTKADLVTTNFHDVVPKQIRLSNLQITKENNNLYYANNLEELQNLPIKTQLLEFIEPLNVKVEERKNIINKSIVDPNVLIGWQVFYFYFFCFSYHILCSYFMYFKNIFSDLFNFKIIYMYSSSHKPN
jgi:hypothetical protein